MSTETYNGVEIPAGWTRVKTGKIQAGDKALGENGHWHELPGRYAGAGVGMWCCVIREVARAGKEKR